MCRCNELTELTGDEAHKYAHEHLQKTGGDGAIWEIDYVCPTTGQRWVQDYPFSSHYETTPRLRRIAEEQIKGSH
jgi:hypothetical protein